MNRPINKGAFRFVPQFRLFTGASHRPSVTIEERPGAVFIPWPGRTEKGGDR